MTTIRSQLNHPRWSLLGLVMVLTLGCAATMAHADAPAVSANFQPLKGNTGADLGGRFRYAITSMEQGADVISTLLLLDREGGVWKELPLAGGDVIQVHLREERQAKEGEGGVRYIIRTPGLLVRAVATRGRQQSIAYASPFAAVRIDQPVDDVFAATSSAPRAPVHLLIAASMVDPATLRLELDCVDILRALKTTVSTTPAAGIVSIDGSDVTISDLTYDADRNLVRLTILDLPGGGHRIHVRGTPRELYQLPAGGDHWTRPLGALENQRQLEVFRVHIATPLAGTHFPTGTVEATGQATHGRPVTSLRVNGAVTPLSLLSQSSGDRCHGRTFRYQFTAKVEPTTLERDFTIGDGAPGALDPGTNGLHVIATDGSHAANDRTWLTMGSLSGSAEAGGGDASRRALVPLAGSQSDLACASPAPVDFAQNGFSVGISEHALAEMIRARLRPELCQRLGDALVALEGCTYNVPKNPCKDQCVSGTDGGLECVGDAASLSSFTDLATAENVMDVSGMSGPVPDQTVRALQGLQVLLGRFFGHNAASFELLTPAHSRETVTVKDEQNGWFEWRYLWVPACEDIGEPHTVRILKRSNVGPDEEISFQVNVICSDIEYDQYKVLDVVTHFDKAVVDTKIRADGKIEVELSTGPIDIHVDPPKYCGDCWLFGCCCGWDPSDVRLRLPDPRIRVTIDVEELLCGKPAGSQVHVDVELGTPDLNVVDGDLAGWACDLVDFLSFGTIGQFVDLVVILAVDPDLSELGREVEAMFSTDFTLPEGFEGVKQVFDHDPQAIGDQVPVALSTHLSPSVSAQPHEGLMLGVHSGFTPTVVDPTMPASVDWVSTPSSIPHALPAQADVYFAASDDALNQMLSALTRTGVLEAQVGEEAAITLRLFGSQLSPEILTLLQYAGIGPDEPLLLSLGTRQGGAIVPPFVTIIDDPATPSVETMVRAQLHTPLIFPRGEDPATVLARVDAGQLCACGDQLLNPACGQACQFGSVVLKLNFYADCSLIRSPVGAHGLQFEVTRVQFADRPMGFAAEESFDLSAAEATTVETAANDLLLEALRARLNSKVPLLKLPKDALTLNGAVVPVGEPWLFTVPSSDPNAIGQSYLGLASRVEGAPPTGCYAGPVATARRRMASSAAPAALAWKGLTPATSTNSRLIAEPNPVSAWGTTLRFSLAAQAEYKMTIYDVHGRRVSVNSGRAAAGVNRIPWSGTDNNGRKLAAGIYQAVMEVGATKLTAKLILLR